MHNAYLHERCKLVKLTRTNQFESCFEHRSAVISLDLEITAILDATLLNPRSVALKRTELLGLKTAYLGAFFNVVIRVELNRQNRMRDADLTKKKKHLVQHGVNVRKIIIELLILVIIFIHACIIVAFLNANKIRVVKKVKQTTSGNSSASPMSPIFKLPSLEKHLMTYSIMFLLELQTWPQNPVLIVSFRVSVLTISASSKHRDPCSRKEKLGKFNTSVR